MDSEKTAPNTSGVIGVPGAEESILNSGPGLSIRDVIGKKILQARAQLVDRNLRNRLINTNITSLRSKQIRTVNAFSDDIFDLFVSKKRSLTFAAAPSENQPPELLGTAANPEDDDSEVDALAMTIDSSPSSLEGDVERLPDTCLRTAHTVEVLQKKLTGIYYESRDYEEEQGVNILFLALGFLKWFEDSNSEIERYAPLILLPVELTRDGARAKFKLKLRDDDFLTNISLKIWLKEQHSIDLPDLPDEELWKPSQYFSLVRESISNSSRWEVLDNEALLGFFSFSKFLLWRDLDDKNWPKGYDLLAHPLLGGLLASDGKAGDAEPPLFPPDERIDKYFKPSDLVYVVDADSSQTEAIETALSGRNMVIQGPPGTGKSQTIANIIAASVFRGKSVLFVAEKMAALNVVHDRLNKVGLGSICLELHSRKSSKQQVLEQIKQSIDAPPPPGVSPRLFGDLHNAQEFLNNHSDELNLPSEPWGYSPFDVIGAICRISGLKIGLPNFKVSPEKLSSKSQIQSILAEVRDFSSRLKISGAPFRHPWRFVRGQPISPLDMERLREHTEQLQKNITALDRELSGLIGKAHLTYSIRRDELTLSSVNDLCRLLRAISKAPDFNANVLASSVLRQNLAELISIKNRLLTIQSSLEKVGDHLAVGWENCDWISLRRRLVASGGSIFSFFNSDYRSCIRELKGLSQKELLRGFHPRLSLVEAAISVLVERKALAETDAALRVELGDIWRGENTPPNSIECLVDWFSELAEIPSPIFQFLRPLLTLKEECPIFENELAGKLRAVEDLCAQISSAASFMPNHPYKDESLRVNTLNDVLSLADTWASSVDRYNEWPALFDGLRHIAGLTSEEFGGKIYSGEIQADIIPELLQLAIFEEIWKGMIREKPYLASIDGQLLHKHHLEFQKLDKERISVASRQVLKSYNERKPNGNAGEMAVIRQEINKKSRHFPVRKLITAAGNAVQRLKPVFLMSPLSVAQYLPPGKLMFDILLIDEASQIKPEDALGAIARCKQLVVVGDDKQLPPTNFFNRLTDTSDEATDPDDLDSGVSLADLESILSLCDTVYGTRCMLRWHYRSLHPGLIAVSNRNFYENKLLLPPSVLLDNSKHGFGVNFVASPQGGYERGISSRNILEAKMVADAIIQFARDNPKKSLGVGTFSVKQRDTIRDLVDANRRKYPEVEPFFSLSRTEPFFVKNLESIQGDERDVIFISVGYGRDKDGRLTQNFGPIGSAGGERRLNVLVSRAKEKCTVFSSITADDIKTDSGKKGVLAFREFLQYAQKGYFDVPISTNRDFDSDFEESVANFLIQSGYTVHPQVGMAGFYIDLAILHPKSPNRYLLGIECDGATYHSSRSARDRDRLRQQILESRGWTIHRVWSTDWFHRRAHEEIKLLSVIDEAIDNKNLISMLGANNHDSFSIDSVTDHEYSSDSNAPPDLNAGSPVVIYEEASEKFSSSLELHSAPPSVLKKIILGIVDIEGPIHQEEVGRRLASSFGLERAGARIQNITLSILKACESSGDIKRKAKFWVSASLASIPIRRRTNVSSPYLKKAEFLPPDEIAEAIRHVVRSSVGISASDLDVETSRLFGFQRTGPDLKDAISRVTNKLLGAELIMGDDGLIRLISS